MPEKMPGNAPDPGFPANAGNFRRRRWNAAGNSRQFPAEPPARRQKSAASTRGISGGVAGNFRTRFTLPPETPPEIGRYCISGHVNQESEGYYI